MTDITQETFLDNVKMNEIVPLLKDLKARLNASHKKVDIELKSLEGIVDVINVINVVNFDIEPNELAAKFLQRAKDLYADRRARTNLFYINIFADAAWDILLDLFIAAGEGKNIGVTSACIAACVPPTTALRWLSEMVDNGLIMRVPDPDDRRRNFVALTDLAIEQMNKYFEKIDRDSVSRVQFEFRTPLKLLPVPIPQSDEQHDALLSADMLPCICGAAS